MTFAAVVLIGLLAGTMGGLLGVGGGIVIVPLLIMLLGVDTKLAIGTSLATIVPTAIMATWRHHHLQHVDWKIAGTMMIGSVVGAVIGASLTSVISADALKRGFAVFLIVTAVRMLWK
jgi:uncharacterized membrane protein YfcA